MPQQGDSIETLYVTLAAKADKLIREADEAVEEVVRRLDRLEDKTQEVERSFGSLGGFIKQTLSTAAGIGIAKLGGSLANAIKGFGAAMISSNAQMQEFRTSFEVLTGSAEEAGEIIEWVKEQAARTPFDVPGLIEASRMLLTWGLDIKEWFTVVGDVAKGMNRPLSQVVNAVGTLASGQTGEAVRRFRDLGINLREYAQLEFDAQGSLVTPLEEAVPIVKQIMIDKFGGMMEKQANTWAGVMANMGDQWQEFVRLTGEPIFETLNQALVDLQTWMTENKEEITEFAQDLGRFLDTALKALMSLLGGIGQFVGQIDGVLKRITGGGILATMEQGIRNYRAIAGFFGGIERGVADFWGGILRGEGPAEAFRGARAAAAETMETIGGYADETKRAEEAVQELTEAQLAGIEAVRGLSDTYSVLSDAYLQQTVDEKRALAESQEMHELMRLSKYMTAEVAEARLEEARVAQEVVSAYDAAKSAYEENIARQEELRASIAAVRAEQEANLELATTVADKLGDRLTSAMERYQETLEDAATSTAEAIAEIESKAAAAEAQAVAKNQQAIARLRADFAREQMRRRRQFNVEWARLIREQNQEVIDAEWEYQYAKENLLIEGDEIALADLEARYKHEKDVRAREQGDARSDTQTRFDLESQERQEQFEQQVRQLEDRLQQELENIRQAAREEVREKEDALEEKRVAEEEAMRERLMKIGEMQAQEVGDNQSVTDMLIEMWRQLYGDQAAEAIRAGVIQRQELEAIRQQALATAEALRNVRLGGAVGTGGRRGPIRRPGGGYARQYGGYSPPGETTVTTHPGEFTSDVATTRALEAATGGPLTQQTVRHLAESRRVIELQGYGLPADILDGIRQQMRDLIDAFDEDVDTF